MPPYTPPQVPPPTRSEHSKLRRRVSTLERHVAALEARVHELTKLVPLAGQEPNWLQRLWKKAGTVGKNSAKSE